MLLVFSFLPSKKDPVPPELVLLLQLSQDSLLQKLFPVETTSQKTSTNEIRTQMKPVVVTVVSKFKVCPIFIPFFKLSTFKAAVCFSSSTLLCTTVRARS